jgi:hypothetical protein
MENIFVLTNILRHTKQAKNKKKKKKKKKFQKIPKKIYSEIYRAIIVEQSWVCRYTQQSTKYHIRESFMLKLLQKMKIQITYFGTTEEHTRQARMRFCPRSSMIHTQMHSHQDSHQLKHFACLLQSPVMIEKKIKI